jgi:hypothetical protein
MSMTPCWGCLHQIYILMSRRHKTTFVVVVVYPLKGLVEEGKGEGKGRGEEGEGKGRRERRGERGRGEGERRWGRRGVYSNIPLDQILRGNNGVNDWLCNGD